jgi:hypothetical protein
MKRILIILIILSFSFDAFSQTKMFINTTSGIDSLWLSNINSITFKTYVSGTIPLDYVACWLFNNNANDTSGHGHNGTLYSVTPDTDRFGTPNSCYRFSGSSSYITIPQDTVFNLTGTNSMSISCWMKSDSIQRHGSALWCKSAMGGNANYSFTFNGNGPDNALTGDSMNVSINRNASSGFSQDPTFFIGNTGYWHHLVVVFSGLECIVYSDGVLVVDTFFNQTPITNTSPFFFGDDSDGGQEYYKGLLDDIRIYKRILTSSEIQSLYHERGW